MNFLPFEVKKVIGLARKTEPNRSEVRQKLDDLLLDDTVEVISTFELNHFAVLTHHDTSMGLTTGEHITEQVTEAIEDIITKPVDHSPLCLTKTLVLAKHILIYGSEQVMTSFLFLGKDVEKLKSYNTVLIQQQKKGVDSFLLRIKGGDVDKGETVRNEAEKVHKFLMKPDYLRDVRNKSADPNSIVPVGSHTKAAFVSDDLRLYYLKKRMEQEQQARTKSNLQKADSSFGAGYNSRDGQAVVGAAHSIEEMLRMEQKASMRFSDEGPAKYTATQPMNYGDHHSQENNDDDILSVSDEPNVSVDLLDFTAPTLASVDLLTVAPTSIAQSLDIDILGSESHTGDDFLMMGTSAPVVDLFGPTIHEARLDPSTKVTTDLLNNMTLQNASQGESSVDGVGVVDPFPVVKEEPQESNEEKLTYAPMTPYDSFIPSVTHVIKHVTEAVHDRFSAFDALSEPDAPPPASAPPPPIPEPQGPLHFESSNIQVSGAGSAPYWNVGYENNDDSESGFVMGGTTGAGLVPLAGPPMDAPPPPPTEPPLPPDTSSDIFG